MNNFSELLDLIESLNINKPYDHTNDDINVLKIKELIKSYETYKDDEIMELIYLSLNSLSYKVLNIIYDFRPDLFKFIIKNNRIVDSLFSESCCEFDYDSDVLKCLEILYKTEIDPEITNEIIDNCINMMFTKCLKFLKDYGFSFTKYKDEFIQSGLYYEDNNIKTDNDIIQLIDNSDIDNIDHIDHIIINI